MDAPLTCPGCSGRLAISDVHDGKRVQCAECRTIGIVRVDQGGAARLEPEGAAVAAAEPGRRCASCGEGLAPGERFCPKCGAGASSAGEAPRKDRVTPARSREGRAAGAGRKKARAASRWILILSILFTIGGTVLGIMTKSTAAQALQNLEGMADDEPYPEEIGGKAYTVGELR
ncbi:MAG: zinc ribbon domain-containing protein, partial [Planctomycetes bacterium]|nr:zinc ribbon domain-containing protein [Planctomycetota bacterium]